MWLNRSIQSAKKSDHRLTCQGSTWAIWNLISTGTANIQDLNSIGVSLTIVVLAAMLMKIEKAVLTGK